MLIKQMLDLQTKLNNNTNGEIWLTGKTAENRAINWNRCIYMEAVEALDSFNWKHWKDINAVDDMDNIKVEIIDIWHFVMSEAIFQKQIDFLEKFEKNKTDFDKEKLITSLEKIVNLTSGYKDIKDVATEFFNALKFAGLSIDELYKRYLVKNVLNGFRQSNGYKDGSYKKLWNGLEDNVCAFEIMEKNQGIEADDLYQKLDEIYANL
jgi:dimeric dUTPase (all-alpha-NTP-PPase superfamily)